MNEKKIELYKSGIDPTNEVGNEGVKLTTVEFTSDEKKISEAKFIIVAVPTPVNTDHTPDLTPVIGASEIVGRNLTKGSIIVYESTVYPGCTEDVCIPILEEKSGLKCGKDFKVGYSPERINPGDKVHRLENIHKIVSGMDEDSLNEIKNVYDLVIEVGTYPVSNIKTAEAVKVVENSQRDINIAFMNELAMVFDRMGIDTNEVVDGMNTKWNALGFRPGLVGGHCIGVDLEFARLTPGEAHFFNLDGDEIEKQTTEIKWDAEAAEKAGFEHFMMKEIHEQPKAVQDTLGSVIKNNCIDLSSVEITEEEIQKFEQIYIVACGSAWHVGMAAQYVIEDLVDVPVRVELASEFRYRKMSINKNSLVIVISQSGETADTLAALRLAKEKGITTLAIVNVVGSSIAREADKVFYTLAGPEISVATTKAYSAQLVAMYCLAVQFARVRNTITEEQYGNYITELLTIPDKIQKILQDKERLQWFAAKYANAHDVFFVGRGIDYAISLEGSLKLKEISYIHSEAYAAGELKHGTISLIEPGTLVIGVLTQSDLYEKTISNMLECKSRGAYLMGLTTYGKYEIEDQVNFAVYVPKIDEHFVGSLAVVPLQLMGYYVSVAKGLDVDKPRNLAKSVTVE